MKNNILLCTLLFNLGLCVTMLVGQVSGASSYTLGADDVISVTIFAGGEKQVEVNVSISGQGMINAPFVGPTKAAGVSTSELEEKLLISLKKDYFVDPQVYIQVSDYQSLRYSISGAVEKPGKFSMQSATTLMELIAKAEGATKERGSVAYIMRDIDSGQANTEPIKVNLTKLLDEGDMSHNIKLQSGDSVYIPLSKGLNQNDSMVFVSGRVKKPGSHEFQPGLTALSVCIMAGGFDEFAAPNRATIVRVEGGEQKVIKIDLEDVVEGKISDVPLKAGDRLNIPESWL